MLDALSKVGTKISELFDDSLFLGDSIKEKKRTREKTFSKEPFSQLLPYQSYDEEKELFFGEKSVGFVIEAIPLIGFDEAGSKILGSIFQETMEEGTSLQCLLLADHRIDPFLTSWASSRRQEEIFSEIFSKRTSYFKEKKEAPPRVFRFIFSYSSQEKNLIKVQETKERMLKSLKALTYAFFWKPEHLLETVGSFVHFDRSTKANKQNWNPFQPLSSQFQTGGKIDVTEDGLHWKNSTFKSYRVVDTPSHISPGTMQRLIGDSLRDSFRIDCPFYIHYGIHCPKQSRAESSFKTRSQLIENQGKSSYLIRLIPELADELKECDLIRRSLSQGARFVWTGLSAGIWAPKEHLGKFHQAIKNVFKINQFKLADNTCLHLPQYLAAMPMTWAEYVEDLKVLDVLKTTLSTECTHFVPIQGEWMGTETPGMLLTGRRGQLLNWNPFDNKSGNYNVVVAGRSGSGKSVFMQEMLLNGLSTGAKVYVLDVGRSFEKMCDVLQGQKIEFSRETEVCLNPFTNISAENVEERETAFSFLKAIISCMAAPTQGTTDHENAYIEKAIKYAWNNKKNQATITDIGLFLTSQEGEIPQKLGMMLTPYMKEGIYEKYFEGKSNISFCNPMVLIELEELKEKKDLQTVVLQLVIMAITNEAFLGDRKTPFYICIDEAWDLLRAKQTGAFIETLARRLRKYRGSLIIGTQSLDDFETTEGAKAAYENSDWMCLLSQKKSSIAKSTKFDPQVQKALETVSTRHGQYSEVMILDGDGNFSIARLNLDPFSSLLYSTKAEEYAKLKDLTNSGMSISSAINHLLKK